MAGLEHTIQQLLGDPESMNQIKSLAKSFGLPAPESSPAEEPSENELRPMLELLRSTSAHPEETKLLEALKPYFTPERQQRFDRALQVARIARLAGTALKTMGRKE